MSRFISTAITPGEPEEVAVFGARGDGKTTGVLAAMIGHAQRHHAAGYPLPTRWMGAADTFESHKRKTHDSLLDRLWGGAWRLQDGGHVAVFALDGVELVRLNLFGVEDQAALDRLRAQAHGLWFEEPAPAAVLVQSSGLSESAWGMGITSCRLPSYRHPKLASLNYPDEENWTWRRFVVDRQPGTAYVRIPPGELASAEQRAEWARALANRPDMLRRLLAGQPGTILLGEQVASGFSYDDHVAVGRRLEATRGVTLWLGQDGGHTPTTVIGQRVHVDGRARVRILAALASEYAGLRQHTKNLVLPWLSEHAPWAIDNAQTIQVRYDPSIDTDEQADIESNPLRVMRSLLPGIYRAGPVSWEGRRDPMLALFNSRDPVLEIDPVAAAGLVKALGGGWYYPTGPDGRVTRDLPKKPNHPHEDHGDAYCYLVAGMAPMRAERVPQPERHAVSAVTDVIDHNRRAPLERRATRMVS